MQLLPITPVVVSGILLPDGTVQLDRPLEMQPGPVEVSVRPIPPQSDRLPDLPIEDSSVSPTFEMPRSGVALGLQPIRILQRLPDPIQSLEVA